MGRKSTFNTKDAEEIVERYEIYALLDPRDGALRYIGKANDAAKRLKTHMRDARRRRTPVYDWINKLTGLGLSPTLTVVEAGDGDWRPVERRLIAEARERGERLLNLADGGDQPAFSIETCRTNAQTLNRRIQTDERFRKLREAKRTLSWALREGYVRNSTRAVMRELAQIEPRMFGCWIAISDREEMPDGSPVQAHG